MKNFRTKILKWRQIYWLDFLLTMTKKEILARYKRARIGILWAFINPLLQMLIMGFVFQFFLPVNVDNYFLFLFVGLLPWNFFSETVTQATNVFVSQRSLVAKARFPREVLVLATILANLFHTLIAVLLLLVFLFFSHFYSLFNNFLLARAAAWSWQLALPIFIKSFFTEIAWGVIAKFLIFALPLFVLLLIFVLGISFLTASLNVKNRDTAFMVRALLSLWFYATPIVYTLDLIPVAWQSPFRLNPMTQIVELFRALFLGVTVSNWLWVLISLLISLLVLTLAWFYFRKNEAFFDDYL